MVLCIVEERPESPMDRERVAEIYLQLDVLPV